MLWPEMSRLSFESRVEAAACAFAVSRIASCWSSYRDGIHARNLAYAARTS